MLGFTNILKNSPIQKEQLFFSTDDTYYEEFIDNSANYVKNIQKNTAFSLYFDKTRKTLFVPEDLYHLFHILKENLGNLYIKKDYKIVFSPKTRCPFIGRCDGISICDFNMQPMDLISLYKEKIEPVLEKPASFMLIFFTSKKIFFNKIKTDNFYYIPDNYLDEEMYFFIDKKLKNYKFAYNKKDAFEKIISLKSHPNLILTNKQEFHDLLEFYNE